MPTSFTQSLLADRPVLPEGAVDLFGRFLGAWDLEVAWYVEGRAVRRERGEWHFARVLGGRAVQDVWIVPPLAEQARGAAVYEHGTSLRFPDPVGGFWHSCWSGPVNGLAAHFEARAVGDDIVLAGTGPGGVALRWIFFELSDLRFRWKNERAAGPGGRFDLVQDFTAARRR